MVYICKDCYLSREPDYIAESDIVETDWNETCEYCGQYGPVVDYVDD